MGQLVRGSGCSVHGVRLAIGTIQRVFRDLGLPRLRRTRKREPGQMKLFEKAEPGESVQVDVKYVQIAGRWAFQYTALDDCTRFRILRLYPRLDHRSSLAFLVALGRAFPCRVTTGQSPHSPSCWGSKPPGSGTDTSGPGARNRTASRAEPPHRSGGVLGPAPLHRLRGGRGSASRMGAHVQLSPFLSRPSGPHSRRKTDRAPPATAGSLGVLCLRALAT